MSGENAMGYEGVRGVDEVLVSRREVKGVGKG